MRLQDYARNPTRRKAYVQQPALLLVGLDVSKTTHDACLGTHEGIGYRKRTCMHSREGFRMFESVVIQQMANHQSRRVLRAMEPSGIYWHGL